MAPRRTNEFQQVVFMIQRQLAGHASVTESALLENRETGEKVEVDILVESAVAGIPLAMAIECTATRRRATVEWVQQMYGKHHALPTQATVLVSKSGYTSSALKTAKSFDMIPLTIEEAEGDVWADIFGSLTSVAIGSFQFRARGAKVCYERQSASQPALEVHPSLLIYRGAPDDPIALSELCKAAISDRRAFETIARQWLQMPREKRPTEFEFEAQWRPAIEATIVNSVGEEYGLTQVDVTIAASLKTAPLELEAARYSGADVAFGTAENIFPDSAERNRPVVVTMARAPHGTWGGGLLIPKFKGGEDKAFDIRPVVPSNDEDA